MHSHMWQCRLQPIINCARPLQPVRSKLTGPTALLLNLVQPCTHAVSLNICRKGSKHGQLRVGTHRWKLSCAVVSPVTSLVVGGTWMHWALLACCAAGGQVLEGRTRAGKLLAAPLLAMVLAMSLSAASVIPTACRTYEMIWQWFMPLAAALYLLESDLRGLASSSMSTVTAFVLGAIGTVVGTLGAWLLVGRHCLGPEGWKVAAALCASYIGGSVNFAAVATALDISSKPLLISSQIVDNLAMAVYLGVIMLIPAKPYPGPQSGLLAGGKGSAPPQPSPVKNPSVESLAMSMAAAVTACALSEALAGWMGMPAASMAIMAAIASLFGSLGSSFGRPSLFHGSEAAGGALMLLFFTTIGAAGGSLTELAGTPWLIGFVGLQLGIHMLIILAGGRLLDLPMQAVLTASNANIGGPGTAAAMATSRGWQHMIRPAMLTGSLGYAIGSAVGCIVGQVLQYM